MTQPQATSLSIALTGSGGAGVMTAGQILLDEGGGLSVRDHEPGMSLKQRDQCPVGLALVPSAEEEDGRTRHPGDGEARAFHRRGRQAAALPAGGGVGSYQR